MNRRINVGIIGPGNIGTDLLMKLLKSEKFNVTAMFGIDNNSSGVKNARDKGVRTFDNGMEGLRDLEESERPEIIFDATSAKAHQGNYELAREFAIKMIDLTPAAIGPFVSPSVNLSEHLDKDNVNMITCGGQATTPIIAAIADVAPVEYAEIVATISSVSAGPGTRANIDEFIETTARAIETVGKADKGKAIIILNPADPPIIMRDTIYTIIKGDFNHDELTQAIKDKVKEIQTYVPGFRLRTDPVFNDNQVSVYVEVEGAGDYLPVYSGNLDIMTASAIGVANRIADDIVEKESMEVN